MSDSVGLVLDPLFERHDTGAGHPERPERLRRIRERLESSGLATTLVRVEPEAVADAVLERVHEADYIAHVAMACASGIATIDAADTAICADSDEIARMAAGSLVRLCDEVRIGRLQRGFAAVRPPGHHAERGVAMGFCLYNNVAVAARALQAEDDVARVLILDWDVHHGNGTQHIFESDPSVMYVSVHQMPLYPGTGAASETGTGAGAGATLNVPLSPGAGDDAFLHALEHDLVAAADRFRPDFVLISAGFDAHARDPLAQLQVSTEAYARATGIVRDIADRHAAGRVVSVLEGGYDLDALAESVEVHVRALL